MENERGAQNLAVAALYTARAVRISSTSSTGIMINFVRSCGLELYPLSKTSSRHFALSTEIVSKNYRQTQILPTQKFSKNTRFHPDELVPPLPPIP